MTQLGDFLVDISQTFPIRQGLNADKVIENARTYLVGKLYNKDIDYQKAKTLIFDDYDKKNGFPEPKVFYHYLSQCIIKHYDDCVDEGSLIAITLPNGRIYDFTVCGFGKPIDLIKDEINKKFGNCTVRKYPKGTVRIGNDFILP